MRELEIGNLIIIATLVAVSLLGYTGAPPVYAAESVNLLSNPMFVGESEQMPRPWLHTTPVSILGERLHFIDHPFDETARVFMIDDPDSQSYGLRSEEIPVEVGVTYSASVIARAEGGRAAIVIDFLDKERKRVAHLQRSTASNDWDRLTATLVAPEGAHSVRIILYSDSVSIGKTYYRDVELVAER